MAFPTPYLPAHYERISGELQSNEFPEMRFCHEYIPGEKNTWDTSGDHEKMGETRAKKS